MTTTQTDEIKTWQQRLEETCPALGPMHIHACVEEVNDAMQAEINDLRVALQEQAREGEAVAKVVLTKTLGLPTMQWLGLDKQFDLADGQLLYTTPQAAQPDHIADTNKMVPADHVEQHLDMVEQPEQVDWKDQYEKQKRRAEMWIAKYEKDIGPLEKVYPAAQPEQGERAEVIDRLEYVASNGVNSSMRELARKAADLLQPAQPVALPLTVDVCFIDGDDPFICTVHGKITVDALSEIEADIHENPDFGKGDGVYSYNVTRFNGQYGFEGRCELPPGWELDEIGYEPIEAAHGIGGAL